MLLTLEFKAKALHRKPLNIYLLRGFVIGYVGAHSKRPFYMNIVLVQLQQKHNQHEQGINHEKGKDRGVTQLFEIVSNASLKLCSKNLL